MPPAGYFVDTNLFLLFVVGSEAPTLIAKHRRLETYSAADYNALLRLLRPPGRILVTPNTLTETSNLLSQHGEPERSRLFRRFRRIIHSSQEVVIASAAAADSPYFEKLGLTDAALLEAVAADTPLVTMDIDLYLAGLTKGADLVVNFTAHRPSAAADG